MNPNEVVAKARKLIASKPDLEASMRGAWGRICDKIQDRALAKRPKPQSYEVRQELEAARLALLTAVVEGRTLEVAEDEALQRLDLNNQDH